MSDSIVFTQQQPDDRGRERRSSAPIGAEGAGTSDDVEPSLVPEGFRFEGLIAFDGSARIDGVLRGNVEGRGRLEIGANAAIEGWIDVDELIVAGTVQGELRARTRVEICAGARVKGPVTAPVLSVADGALLDGPCRTEGPPHEGLSALQQTDSAG